MRDRDSKIAHRARIVVIGAGFAGASLIRNLPPALRRSGETLVIDRSDYYTFAPLLHEAAVGRIHPDSIHSPIAPAIEDRARFLRTDILDVDLDARVLETTAGAVRYEYLVLAPGSGPSVPPRGLKEYFHAFGTLDDALALRGTLNQTWLDATEQRHEPEPGALTVALVGGGATGVELAAEIRVLFDYLKLRSAKASEAQPRVVLIEAENRLMGWLHPYFHQTAMNRLSRLGVEVRLGQAVESADECGVQLGEEWLPARTRIWTAGVQVSSLAGKLPSGSEEAARVPVDSHLTLPDHPEVYVLGDAGAYEDPRYGSLSPTASLAVQQGPWVARDLGRRVVNSENRPPFRFFNRGYIVSLGPEDAVAEAAGARFKGPAAQALYRSVLLYYLKSRRDQILTGADWAMERTIGRVGFGAVPDPASARTNA